MCAILSAGDIGEAPDILTGEMGTIGQRDIDIRKGVRIPRV